MATNTDIYTREQDRGYIARFGPLFEQYAVGIGRFTEWLDEHALPIMEAQEYEIVGGLEGMLDRARVVGVFAEQDSVSAEIVEALVGAISILEVLESEVEMLEMLESGVEKHGAILAALRGCLKSLA